MFNAHLGTLWNLWPSYFCVCVWKKPKKKTVTRARLTGGDNYPVGFFFFDPSVITSSSNKF